MPLTTDQEAARSRLATLYNGAQYDATTNPGGMAEGGHIVNFEPSLQDMATLGQGIAALADGAATAAATSATNAATSATTAAGSATAASGSASSAATSASAAAASQSAAASSATAASTSATTASTQATNAAGSATAAGTSATAAAGSASSASASATTATTRATEAATSATNAASSAASAAASATAAAGQAAALTATSSTSNVIGVGSKTFTTQSGKSFPVGSALMITSDADPTARRMVGIVSAYSGTSLTVDVSSTLGSGTYTDWTIRLSGPAGTNGTSGWSPTLAGVADGARRVLQVTDWAGGTGTKPATGVYVGATGFTSVLADATDVRGAAGSGSGDVTTTGSVTANHVALFNDGTGDVLKSGGALAAVATSGSYNDLSSKPTIPTVPSDIGAAAASHTHTIANVTGLQAALDGKQADDATLTAIAGVTTGANKVIYFSGVDAAAATDLSAFGRTLIDDADASAARTTLGLGTAATTPATDYQASDATLTGLAALTTTADQMIYATGANTFAMTGLSTFGRSLVDDNDATAARTTLGLGTASTSASTDFAAASHTHPATGISDSTAAGRTLLTAANAGAQKTALGLVKGDVGLGNVDNTSDANKPVSTATQTALDAKLAISSQATVSDIRTGTNDTTYTTPKDSMDANAFQTLTDAATVTWDANAGYNARVTLGGNRTLSAPSNPKEGMTYTLLVIQDATGSRVPVVPGSWDFGGDGAPTFSTAAGTRDMVVLLCENASTPLFVASLKKGS